MAVRPTMADLISRVRMNIGDAAGADQVFSDQEIQDTLDARRRDWYELPLNPAPNERDFFAPGGWWEADATITRADDTEVTALTTPAIDSTNYVVGQWTLDSDSDGLTLYVTGKQYDLNGASADLLDAWIGKVKLEFDFLELGSTFKSSQQVTMLEVAAKRFRSRQWLSSVDASRNDVLSGWYV